MTLTGHDENKMDYLTVTLTANFTAFVTTACLFVFVVIQATKQTWKKYIALGVFGQLIWSLAELTSYYKDLDFILLLEIELFRLTLWLISLFLLLSKRTTFKRWPRKSQALSVIGLFLAVITFTLVLIDGIGANVIRLSLMILTTFCLIFTEQVVRNLNTHRMMKLFGLCLTFIFAFDILMYGQSIVSNSVPTLLLQSRSALAFTFAAALAVGSLIFDEQNDNQYLFTVSRPAAFFSTTLFASLLLIGIGSFGSYYVNGHGFLGTYLFSLAFLIALLLFFALIISRTFRQHFEVFISKHFFALKYDYRIEWLNAIRQLSELRSDHHDYYDQVLNILKSALRSTSGSLWINSGSEIKYVTGKLLPENCPKGVAVSDEFVRTMLKESWIYAPQSHESSLSENNRLLPEWLLNSDKVWLVAPLIIQMKLVGFVILSPPKVATSITFEDRDLMTNISTQVASHILLHQQEKVISDSKQMETYNRLSAFIMHDINNVIAQLALIGKNAERHRNNPAFVDDMIKTVHNATSRMQSLIQKFNPASKEKRTTFPVSELCQELKQDFNRSLPIPTIQIDVDFQIEADKQRLSLAVKNLIRNAQEATDEDGFVLLHAKKTMGGKQLLIKDSGHGMSQRFIDEELFRPFVTTKETNGVGIGAYLTKSYLEHLGATLKVYSKEGEGSLFEITFS